MVFSMFLFNHLINVFLPLPAQPRLLSISASFFRKSASIVRVLFLPAKSGFLPAAFRVLTFPLLVFVFHVCHEEPPLPASRIL